MKSSAVTSSTSGGGQVVRQLAQVHLAVARHADRDDLAVDLDQQVLQGRRGRDAQVLGEGLDRGGVGGVQLLDGTVRGGVHRLGREGHGLGVRRVVAGGAVDEGVLARRGRSQELLGRRAAHRTRDRRARCGGRVPRRRKILMYASRCSAYDSARPSSLVSKEYESFIWNSRPRRMPERGRASSRYFVWIW